MSEKQPDVEDIARAIYDYLRGPEDGAVSDYALPPYSFNEDDTDLSINVDGFLDCKVLAEFIRDRLYAS